VQGEAALRALSEPRRRAILRLVRDQPRAAGEIAEHFEVTQQAVSQHLQVLKDAGLLEMRKDGRRRLYGIRTQGLEALDAFLVDLWPAGLQRLKRAVEDDDG
jgi:DNA-binding transcriptional ArsR family regulator